MKHINKFILFEHRYNLKKVKTDRFVYHSSNPFYREEITKLGLISKGRSENWLSNTKIDGEVIFASNSEKDWFCSGYDDDIYKIDTSLIDNEWFQDPNFCDDKYIITFKNIPLDYITLIYKGNGKSFE